MEISVRQAGDPNPRTVLGPRQQMTPSPYSLHTLSATFADALSGACVGCVTNAQINSIDGGKVTGTVANATNANSANTASTAGSVTGIVQIENGGTGSSTKSFVDLSTNQSGIGGNKSFTGVLSGIGSGLTNLNGGNITDETITRAKLAYGATSRYDLQLIAMLRWDLLPTQTTISVGSDPEAIAFDGTLIYVANSGSNNVTRIRASTGALEGSPIAVGSAPKALAYDGVFVYVANFGSGTVTRIRATTGIVEGSPITVGDSPRSLVFDGTFVYAGNQVATGTVTRIRAATGIIEGSPILVGANPSALVFDGTFVYVANAGSNNVMRIRASTGVVEGGPIIVGSSPSALAFDGTFIYVMKRDSDNSGTIGRIRASTGILEAGVREARLTSHLRLSLMERLCTWLDWAA